MSDRHAISPYPLRMPDELRAMLESSAQGVGRSLHAEIVARLERTLQDDTSALSADLIEAVRLQANLTLALVDSLGIELQSQDQQRALEALAGVSRRVAEQLSGVDG